MSREQGREKSTIMVVADVYDALRTKFHYKAAFTHDKTREIILKAGGMHFDPDVIHAFKEVASAFDEIRNQMNESAS
jgi:response regulator RpfG family c-di-GMP phosphodiesterase